MLTAEQEKFLASFADKQIELDRLEVERIAKSDIDNKVFIERQQFIESLKIQKAQETDIAIQEYDSKL